MNYSDEHLNGSIKKISGKTPQLLETPQLLVYSRFTL